MKRLCIVVATIALAITAWLLEPTGWLTAMVVTAAISSTIMRYAVHNILAISYRKRLYDQPGGRHIHKTPIPRLGGVAFAPVICCTTILGLAFHSLLWPTHHGAVPDCLMWISALIFIHMTGVIDDMAGVGYPIKFATQIIAALLVVASGFWIDNMWGLFGVYTLGPWVGMPLTVLFIVAVINALNLIDGMDGLAAGLCALALIVYGVHGFVMHRYFFAMVAVAGLGVLVPFFWSNTRGVGRRRHKLFMGDTGSQTLGLVVGVLAVGQMMKDGTVLAKQDFILALSPLIVPVFDVAHVVFFRLVRGNHPFRPDMTHIHHRFVKWGFSNRGAVAAILAMAAGYVLMNTILACHMGPTWILALDMAAWCLLNVALGALGKEKDFTCEIKRRVRTTLTQKN